MFFWKRMDWLFVSSIITLVVIGVLFIFSASSRQDDLQMTALTQRQILWALLGFVIFFGAVVMDYHKIGRSSFIFYLVCLALLVVVLTLDKKSMAPRAGFRCLVFKFNHLNSQNWR
ncbi:MAG: FtsW/RodA/SpoVE family cell cycle protein [Kiritimatiellae bacterium]|nr:FtsW/RodA/SpoVE family cell cycle protein [Kiritimatiellia bacterium]